MMRAWMNAFLCLLVTVAAVTSLGCRRDEYDKRYFVLEAARAEVVKAPASDRVLEVRRFTIAAAFGENALVYRTGPFSYETDFYNQFFVAPAAMVTEKAQHWLARSGLFARVLTTGSRLRPTHTLEGNIIALYGDLRDPADPAAVVELRCFLVANEEGTGMPAFNQTYNVSRPIPSRTPEAVIEALDQCLADILRRLEEDLRQTLS